MRLVNLGARPPFRWRKDADPRRYDLRPRPTTRGFPFGWSRVGAYRHRMKHLRAMTVLAYLPHLTDPRRSPVDDAAGRACRRTLARELTALHEQMHGATTEPMPRIAPERAS